MKMAKFLKTTALVILGLAGFYWLVMAILGILAGNSAGAANLVQVVAAVLLGWLGWKRPLLAGILMTLGSVVLAMYFLLVLYSIYQAMGPLLLLCAPLAISGILLIEADWKAKKANES